MMEIRVSGCRGFGFVELAINSRMFSCSGLMELPESSVHIFMKNYKKLNVWTNSIKLCNQVYELAKKLPASEKYGLYSQITRSVVSIPSNIAEGCAKSSTKDFNRFLEIALGSAFELETQLIIIRQNMMNNEKLITATEKTLIIQKQLSALLSHNKTNTLSPQKPNTQAP